MPDKLKYQVVSHNPQTLDETVQRVLLCEAMISPEENCICALDDRVTTTKISDFVNKLSTSLDEIEKTFDRFRQTADRINQPEKPVMNFPTCGTCGKSNHSEYNCFHKQSYNNRQFRPSQSIRADIRPYWSTPQRQYYPNQRQYQSSRETQYNRPQYGVPRPQYSQTREPAMKTFYNKPTGQLQQRYGDRCPQPEDRYQSKNGVGPRA